MKWYKKLSTGNKIAFISLLIGIAALSITAYQFFQKTDNDSNAVHLQTKGSNSPIVNDTKGNVNMNFKTGGADK